jgi:hypothetical protein
MNYFTSFSFKAKQLKNKNAIPSFLLFLVLLSASNVYANGIPVIFAVTVFHLFIINSIVMGVEYALLRALSKLRVRVGFIILANIASIFLAYMVTDSAIASLLHTQWFGLAGKGVIEKKYFISGVSIFIGMTILIEWIFFHFAQVGKRNLFRSLKYAAIINLLTNIPIAIFYLLSNSYYETGE